MNALLSLVTLREKSQQKRQNPCLGVLVSCFVPRPRLGLFRAAGRAAAASHLTTGNVVEIPEGTSEHPPVTSRAGEGLPWVNVYWETSPTTQ